MLPPKTDPRWRALAEGRLAFEPSFLALKFLLQRIHLRLYADSQKLHVEEMIDDLYAFFEKYERFLAEDIKRAFH